MGWHILSEVCYLESLWVWVPDLDLAATQHPGPEGGNGVKQGMDALSNSGARNMLRLRQDGNDFRYFNMASDWLLDVLLTNWKINIDFNMEIPQLSRWSANMSYFSLLWYQTVCWPFSRLTCKMCLFLCGWHQCHVYEVNGYSQYHSVSIEITK